MHPTNKQWEEPKNNLATAISSPSLLDRIVEQQAETAARYKPVMSIQELIDREKAIQYLVDNVMAEGIDYGWIPGTRPKEQAKPGEYQAKPTLFKAGAERACAFFGYAPQFTPQEVIEQWTADKYGEPLFYYRYQCDLTKDGHAIGSGIGSATTWESKYRYRKGERECPACGKSGSIIKGKAEYGGGWLCFQKKGGCGAKFAAGDESIESQVVEQVPNPDIADVVNTVQKMAQKRAYVAATLTATGLSGRFTQDLEDLPAPKIPEPTKQEKPEQQNTNGKHSLTFAEKVAEFTREKIRVGEDAYYACLGAGGYEHSNEICKRDRQEMIRMFRALKALPDLADTAKETEL